MKFSAFIEANRDAILDEWHAFSKTMLPAAKTMSAEQLRDHCGAILSAITEDMKTSQTEAERRAKSPHVRRKPGAAETAASVHGATRQLSGFDFIQLVGEFRALRASVLRAWSRADGQATTPGHEEMVRFNEALDQALAESVERYSIDAAKARDMFLAVLGHDVRSPLSGIRLATDVLAMPSLSEPVRLQVAMRIRRASEVIGRLTTDLLEFARSRLGRGRIPIERSSCDLRRICEEALDAVRGSYPDREFVQRLSGDLRAECDPPRIQQVLSNLLNNAVQHGDPALPIGLEALGSEDAIVIRVSNFGNPIPADALQTIFEPLVQRPRTEPQPPPQGQPQTQPHEQPPEQMRTSLGLGLYIVREIVRGHRGTVGVASSADAGTVFTVELPHVAPAA